MVLNALSQPNLAPNAALAFRDLCIECAEMLVPVAVQLIPACQVCWLAKLAIALTDFFFLHSLVYTQVLKCLG